MVAHATRILSPRERISSARETHFFPENAFRRPEKSFVVRDLILILQPEQDLTRRLDIIEEGWAGCHHLILPDVKEDYKNMLYSLPKNVMYEGV